MGETDIVPCGRQVLAVGVGRRVAALPVENVREALPRVCRDRLAAAESSAFRSATNVASIVLATTPGALGPHM